MREYIVSNLKDAANVLPYKYEDTNYGRFTKGLANTLLLKFYMMTKQWDEAEKIGRELTKPEYGYKLVDDYNSLFSLSGEKNSEALVRDISPYHTRTFRIGNRIVVFIMGKLKVIVDLQPRS